MNLSDFGDERGALHFAGEFQHGKQHFTSLNQMGEKNLKIKTLYKSKSVQQIMPIAIFRKTDVQQWNFQECAPNLESYNQNHWWFFAGFKKKKKLKKKGSHSVLDYFILQDCEKRLTTNKQAREEWLNNT